MGEDVASRRSMWPATIGCAIVSAGIVAALLVPLEPTLRDWIVRGLLVVIAVGAFVLIVATGRIDPTTIDRPERVAFQVAFFWGFFTGLVFTVPAFGGMEPAAAVLSGTIATLLSGAGLWVLDPWVTRRRGA